VTAFLLAGPVASFILANTPPPEFNPDTVTPGPAGFVAIFFIAAMVVLLGFDLNRRIRRNTYRAQIKERLAAEIAANKWLPDSEMAVYAEEYGRNGYQGGLQWYRCGTTGKFNSELEVFAGRTIDVPSCFIAGRSDWGPYQRSGDPEKMLRHACTQFRGFHLVDGAGHWVQQEQPEKVSALLVDFLKRTD